MALQRRRCARGDEPLATALGEPGRARDVARGAGGAVHLSLALLATYVLFAREVRLGRFEPLPRVAAVGGEWFRTNILSLSPELVGAVHHQEVGPREVAALLARLGLEGKLASRVLA